MEQISKKFMNWASILEDNTKAQVQMTSEMPFIYPHIALMPDAHLGKGCAIGTVLPTLGAIIPAAVGVDIGCGMIAVRTQYEKRDLQGDLKVLREDIEKLVPLSAGKYNVDVWHPTTQARINYLEAKAESYGFDPAAYAENWRLQLGSLGSGNHFIEISLDEEDCVWLFLHSGSRGVGNKIAQHHIKVAQRQCAQRYIQLPDKDLAYLVEGDDEFWAYIRELNWAQSFAFENRAEMMDRVVWAFESFMNGPVDRMMQVNCHHNYTEQEEVWGKKVWLSRKGAIDASMGRLGLIPGSMGTRSYVVVGKGSKLGLNSSPHGAGREYGRMAAKRSFSYEQLVATMEGIEWSGSKEFIDEIPYAYKDIDVVMRDAEDLVEIKHTLRQIVNVKGD